MKEDLLHTAQKLSRGLHAEEARGVVFSKKFDAIWEELTEQIQTEMARRLRIGRGGQR